MTPGGILIEANRTALKVANLQQQDVFGLPLEESYWWSWSSEEQDRLREAIQMAAAGIPSRYDALLRIGEVEYRTIDFMLSPMFGDDGRVAYLIPSAIDITERKQAEQALQKNKERLELLANVAEKLLRSEDPQAIIEDLCRVVLTHLDCQFFFNYLIDGPDQNLILNAFAGFCAEDAARIRKLDPAASLCGRAAKDGHRIFVDNIQHDDDPRTQLARAYGVQAYCCHPLTAQDRVLGTLSFATSTRKSFSADEIALMKSVSDQVALAIQRVQAEKMLQQLNRSLMQQVAERTALAEGRAKQLQSLG
jgi:PAS domain S-box-containing protein